MQEDAWNPWMEAPHDKRQLLGTPDQGAGALPLTPPPFNAASQRVSTTGSHAYVDPGPNDQRGECPGLNALANQYAHSDYLYIVLFTNGATVDIFLTTELQLSPNS